MIKINIKMPTSCSNCFCYKDEGGLCGAMYLKRVKFNGVEKPIFDEYEHGIIDKKYIKDWHKWYRLSISTRGDNCPLTEE